MDLDNGALPEDERAVAGVLERPRLARRLDRREPRITVVRAASGAGKTTLVRSWAVQRPGSEPLVWLSVSAPIDSPATLWTRLAEAAERSGILEARLVRALVRRVTVEADPTGAAIDFLADGGPVTFVIDAYEKVGEAIEAIDAALLRLVDALPEVRVVLTARGGTGLAAEGLRLRDRTHVIEDRDLALTQDEIGALLELHLPTVPPGAARLAAAATGGYALAVRALILSMAHGGGLPGSGSYRWGDLVAADLRSQLPSPAVARFVSLTCIPPYFDAELARSMTGRRDGTAVLADLERQGFGRWIPYAHGHPVFQYVDAVREAFTQELRSQDPSGYRRAATAAAQWLFEHEDHEAAFELAVAAGDYPLAVVIFVSVLRTYPESYISARLLDSLAKVPRSALRRHPMLAFALGLAQAAHPVLRSSAHDAFAIAARQPVDGRILGTELDRFVAGSVRAVGLRLSYRFQEAARSTLLAIAELDKLQEGSQQRSREAVAMILRQHGYTLLQGGRYDDALATFVRSAALTQVRSTRNYALAYVVGTYGFVGRPEDARTALGEIDGAAWPGNHSQTYLNVMTLVGEGFIALDGGDPARALTLVEDARTFAPIAEFWPFVTTVGLHAEMALRRGLAEARRVDALLRGPFPPPGTGDNVGTRATKNMLAIAWLAGGRVTRAERVLAEADPSWPEIVPARLLHALVTGREASALERVLGSLSLPGHTVRSRAATLVLGAAAALRQGDVTLATTMLGRAEDLQRHHGVAAHLDLVPARDRQAMVALAEDTGHSEMAHWIWDRGEGVIPATASIVSLTRREQVVLEALVSAPSREQIAARLSVSPNTVKSQLRSIYRKLGVTTRESALRAAVDNELLGEPDAAG